MNKLWDILGLVIILIVAVFAFPEDAIKILHNKFYMLMGGLLIFLILFIVWLKLKTKY